MKQKIQKAISFLLITMIMMSMLTTTMLTAGAVSNVTVYPADELVEIDDYNIDFEYKVLSDGTATITKYVGNGGKVVIPSAIDGYKVTAIGKSAFEECASMTSVTIPNTVTTIGSRAFYLCKRLTSLEIPNSVTTIAWYAFRNCISLKTIKIPSSVVSIGNAAFSGCKNLENFYVDENNANYVAVNNVLFNKALTTLVQYSCGSKDSTYTVKDGVTVIDEYAFAYGQSLEGVTIPRSVTSISKNAFRECKKFTTIYGYAGSYAEQYASENGYIFIDLTEYDSSDDYLYEVVDNGTATITKYLGYGGNIKIPAVIDGYKVTVIGVSAFENCYGLISVVIPYGVTEIDDYAFANCYGMESVSIPNSVIRIGKYAFAHCYSLKNVVIPDSVTEIDEYAFFDCQALESVELSSGLTVIKKGVFKGCHRLKKVVIPDGVTEICSEAFADCQSLEYVIIARSVTKIADDAFEGCNSLKTIYGYTGSFAEEYANEHGYTFVPLD